MTDEDLIRERDTLREEITTTRGGLCLGFTFDDIFIINDNLSVQIYCDEKGRKKARFLDLNKSNNYISRLSNYIPPGDYKDE